VTRPRTARPKNRDSTTGRGKKFFSSRNVQFKYEGWNFNSGNYLFTTDTK